MKIVTVDGRKQYIAKKWVATTVIFYVAIAACVAVIISAIVRFCMGKILSGDLFHDIGMSIGALAMVFLPLVMKKWWKWYIPNLLEFAMYFIIIMNMLGGEVLHLFNAQAFSGMRLYDKFMHTFNGVIFMFFGYSVLGMMNNIPEKNSGLSPLFCALFAIAFSMLIEYVWEIYEYTLDSISDVFNMQRWKDDLVSLLPNENGYWEITTRRGSAIVDTMTDMIVHLIGSLPIAVLGVIQMKRHGNDFILQTCVLSKKQVAYLQKFNAEQDSADAKETDVSQVAEEAAADGQADCDEKAQC